MGGWGEDRAPPPLPPPVVNYTQEPKPEVMELPSADYAQQTANEEADRGRRLRYPEQEDVLSGRLGKNL